MTSPKIQKDIVSACAQETIKAIIDDLDRDYYGILVDESKDIFDHEQMALALRLSKIRGQGYDGASNMKGEMNGLKALILKDTPSVHYIHCFAHQLQLTLVVVAKKVKEVETFISLSANMLNVVGASFNCSDQLPEHQAELLEKLLKSGGIQSGKGLNQERGFQRPGDTRWGSHFRTLDDFIILFSYIIHVLEVIKCEGSNPSDRLHGKAYLIETIGFEFAFLLHLMLKVLVLSNELSKALQRKEQDIINVMVFLDLTKERLQKLREEAWKAFMDEISSFCAKHDILVPKMEEFYIPEKSKRRLSSVTYSHHLQAELFYVVIDLQLQKLNNHFDGVSDYLPLGICLA
ncbi:uncharacterized protein LOC132601729 [Lycium barbarum]|uniref:uncharacterized protein LOC132601729 n=1 Tax=Lycium barbarum TaxID=112863 RepID=UPI00293E58E9|nr:uncharacterized protein LOC132601729 [Lycium barbarum]